MKLKTYTAETMAQALAQVRKDLGKNAMILHTRSYRVGAWFGLGGKTMVEITASSPAVTADKTPRAMPRVSREQPPARVAAPAHAAAAQSAPSQTVESKPLAREPELVIQRGRTVTRQRLAQPAAVGAMSSASIQNGSVSNQPDQTERADHRGLEGRDALFGGESEAARSIPNHPNPARKSPTINPAKPVDATPSRFTDQPVSSVRVPQDSTRSNEPKKFVEPTLHVGAPNNTTSDSKSTSADADQDGQTNTELRSQIDTLQKMMGQVLESTRKTAVAVGTNSAESALPSGEMPAPLFALYAQMMDNDVPVDLADKLVGSVRDRLDSIELKDPMIVRQALLREIESTISTRSESLLTLDHRSSTGRPRVIALVGPTGVGKTTTVAKLAATYKLRHGKKVGLVTSDTYRIAAVEQLRTYAGIIGLPLKVANSPEEMAKAVAELGNCDVVVVDTAGRSQNDSRRLEELAEFAQAAGPDETHLVLSTTVGDNVLRKTAQRFKALGPDRCILTKLDEAVTTGPIAGLSDRIGLPLSFITVGQEVPDDLEPARADRLARCVLDGPEAVVRSWNEDNG